VPNKFRTNTPDSMPEPRKTKPVKPGTVPENRVPIFDYAGRPRGAVGKLATSVTVSRFTGTLNNRLGKKDGRTAWIGGAPEGPNKAAQQQMAKLRASLRGARGSVSSRGK
jgi:hypothetical protein